MNDRIILYPIGEDGTVDGIVGTGTRHELSYVAKDICRSMVSMYQGLGFVKPWIGYLAMQNGQASQVEVLIIIPADTE